LLDFGLAKFVDQISWERATTRSMPSQHLTGTGDILGTPGYMAPEQALGRTINASTDVYAAGVVLFELLTGEGPFYAEDFSGMVRAHAVAPVPKLAELRPALCARPELEAVVQKALAKRPGDRYANAGEMREALRGVPLPAAILSE